MKTKKVKLFRPLFKLDFFPRKEKNRVYSRREINFWSQLLIRKNNLTAFSLNRQSSGYPQRYCWRIYPSKCPSEPLNRRLVLWFLKTFLSLLLLSGDFIFNLRSITLWITQTVNLEKICCLFSSGCFYHWVKNNSPLHFSLFQFYQTGMKIFDPTWWIIQKKFHITPEVTKVLTGTHDRSRVTD